MARIIKTDAYIIHKEATNEVTCKHFDGNVVNTLNNRAFVLHKGRMLEVVRRGRDNTRVRDSLLTNTPSFLVPTSELTDYVHVDGRS